MNNNTRVLLVIVSMFFSLSAFAAEGSLQVKCVDASGTLLEGAKVKFICLSCPMTPGDDLKSKTKKSNSDGMAEFKKLDFAVYRIFGRKKGFAASLYEYIDLQTPSISITLEFTVGEDRKLHFEDFSIAEEISRMQDEGMELYESGKTSEAITMLEKAITLNPSNLDTYYDLTKIYLSESKFDRGEELLNQLSHIASILVKTYNPYVQPGYYKKMIENAANLRDKLPVIKADNALQEKNYNMAISGFRDLIKKDPSDSTFHARLAVALANTQKHDEALQAIKKATNLAPGDKAIIDLRNQILTEKTKADLLKSQTLVNEGDTLIKAGDFESALKKFEGSLAFLPEQVQSPIWRQIGLIQVKLNQSDPAVESFKKALALAPKEKHGDYVKPLFQHYVGETRYEEALSLLVDPQITEPADAEKILLMAADTYSDSLPKFAVTALERTIRVNPDNIDAHFRLGQMYYADGKDFDLRTRELLNKYSELGRDPEKLEKTENMLVVVNKRSPEETEQ